MHGSHTFQFGTLETARTSSETNLTHMWCRVRELNPGHSSGRRTLSPLCNPCILWNKLNSHRHVKRDKENMLYNSDKWGGKLPYPPPYPPPYPSKTSYPKICHAFDLFQFSSLIIYKYFSLTQWSEYVNRIILYGFQVWCCQLTGKTNLKYGEAVASEEQALKRLESFPKYLEKPILELVHHSKYSLYICSTDNSSVV